MAAPKNKKTEQVNTQSSKDVTRRQQDHALNWSMLFLAIAIISLLGITHPFDIEIFENINKGLKYLLGKCHILCPILFFFFSGRMLLGIALGRLNASFVSFLLILFCLPGLVHHLRIEEHQELVPWSLTHGGGFIGGIITIALRRALGDDGTLAVLIVGLTIAFAIVFPWKMVFGSRKKKDDKYDAYLEQTRRRKADEAVRKPVVQEPKPVFKAEPKPVRKPVASTAPVPKQDVYNDDEFSSFTDGIKKDNAFKRILSFGNGSDDTYEDIKEEIENDPVQIPEWEEDPRREVVLRPVINYGESNTKPQLSQKPTAKPAAKPAEEIITNPYRKLKEETVAEPVFIPEPGFMPDEPEAEQEPKASAKPEKEPERPAFVIHERKDEAELNNQAVDAASAINKAAVAEQGSEVMQKAAEPRKPVAPPKPKYKFPPYELLAAPKRKDAAAGKAEIMQQCSTLEQTLADFKVRANVIAATRGPAVTQFELQPAPGVKVNSVVNLADDIALRLAAQGVRIEAPIPGKSAIGIEVPNLKTDPVTFREVVDSDMVRAQRGKITVGLGKDISGDIITADIAKMPHLLIAGSTGSGKSVCINTIICGILYKALPEEVKLILVDPKVVELSIYDGIPHLLTPVVTDPKKAASALHWAVAEMERRYKLFADNHVRNIDGFNKDKEGEDKLPYIVIIIDEMADLMVCVKADIETAVMRLAAKARAAGIHMILATQRPSVDVITGVLKNNIPSRIAFAVTSLIDSRTILDSAGAEKLLGKGDMLYSPYGSSKPTRVQGCFVSDEEVGAIVDFIKDQSLPVEYSEEVTSMELESDKKAAVEEDVDAPSAGPTDDPLFEKALMLVLDTGQASASMMQRRFSIGYNRAARLVDTMAELGVVGKSMGSKPREVIMSRQEAEERFLHNE